VVVSGFKNLCFGYGIIVIVACVWTIKTQIVLGKANIRVERLSSHFIRKLTWKRV